MLLVQFCERGLDGVGVVGAGNIQPAILHHVARAVIPCTKKRAKLFHAGFHVGCDGPRKICKPARTGLDVECGEFGSQCQNFWIDAGANLAAQLVAQLLADFVGTVT
ncbi:hypothetical protein, partial [Brucella sp. 10RB9212]|uniref:hypothetical protein n=1 Tax=Brucella sp. 10RB9212 TaxID=1844034 RepID=UPI0019D624F6